MSNMLCHLSCQNSLNSACQCMSCDPRGDSVCRRACCFRFPPGIQAIHRNPVPDETLPVILIFTTREGCLTNLVRSSREMQQQRPPLLQILFFHLLSVSFYNATDGQTGRQETGRQRGADRDRQIDR